MLRRIIISNAVCVFFAVLISSMMPPVVNVVVPGPAYPATKGEVWPKPQQESKQYTYYKLAPAVFKFTVKGKTCDILKAAIERYTNVLRSTHHIAWKHSKKIWKHAKARSTDVDPDFKGSLQELQINLSAPCEAYPHLEMIEKYSLNVSAVSTLESESIWGILRGMESFAQLFYMTKGYKDVLINETQIVDFPIYMYRGLLIDTSRHYLTVANILKTLDAMEMNKMNVLHWHIVDDQSFPYQSEKFPQLSLQGAYDPTMIYTKTNINQIVNYARDRGIRVLPEFDVPGHTRSWGVAYPSILTKCYQQGKEVGLGPMDPTNNVTYKLIGDLFREVQEWFPDKYFHLGGDEVAMDCWSSNPDLVKFMKKHNMTKPSQLHAYFMTKVIPLLGQKSKPIVWQEVFDEGVKLPSNAIIQVWKTVGAQDMIPILAAGHKVIYSATWYLDKLDDGDDWLKFYTLDPRQMIASDVLDLNNIVGGEACMWGEMVDDTNLFTRVWPKASGVAEVLWMAPQPRYTFTSVYDITSRLEEHILTAGHKLIYSSSWYLDYLDTGGDWNKFYIADPRRMIPKHYNYLDLNNILGGEACMWGESVDDRNLISRVWPRTSAIAEKLWSAKEPQDNYNKSSLLEVSCRLEEHACRMNRRGVHAQPPNGPGFCIA